MQDDLRKLCEDFIRNHDEIKSSFKLETDNIFPVCANIFLTKKQSADTNAIIECKSIIKNNTGALGVFRSSVFAPSACMLSCSNDPEKLMTDTIRNYNILKKNFFSSEYLALASIVISDMYKNSDISENIARAKKLYVEMTGKPVIDDEMSSVFSILASFCDKSDEDIISDYRESMNNLKGFTNKQYLRSVALILAIDDRASKEKCDRFISLFNKLREYGIKYGKEYNLPVLASTVLCDKDIDTLAKEICDVDEFLSHQKRYSGIFGYEKKERYMHSAMIVCSYNSSSEENALIAASSALSLIILQMMVLFVIVIF